MALPSISDLKLWVGTLLTKNEWDFNFTKIVSWFSDGTADLVVNSITSENGIDLNGSRLTNVGAATSGTDAVNLDTAQSLLNQTSYYTLFSVASGKEDASGNAAFLQKDSDTQVTILAGNTNPDLVLCQSDGTVETLTSNVVLTVDTHDDTYYIIKEKGQTPVIISGNFRIGKVLPSSDLYAGDYFLDNSTVPFKGYKYDSLSGWVETPFCYLGKVKKTSGTATVTPVQYDDNGYNLNVYNAKFFPDYSRNISISNGDAMEYDGLLILKGTLGSAGSNATGIKVSINSVEIAYSYGDGLGYTISLLVSKNDVISWTYNSAGSPLHSGETFKLYPLKGV